MILRRLPGGGVKKDIFTEATGEKYPREWMILLDQASGVGSDVILSANFVSLYLLYFVVSHVVVILVTRLCCSV